MFEGRREFRIGFQIGIIEIDHADRCSGGRHLEWTGIEVRGLVRSEQREPPAACHAARDIFLGVEMRCNPDTIADPHARFDIGQDIQPVVAIKSRQQIADGFRLHGHRGRVGNGARPEQVLQEGFEPALNPDEVEAGQIGIVKEPPLRIGACANGVYRAGDTPFQKIAGNRLVPLPGARDRWPFGNKPAHYHRSNAVADGSQVFGGLRGRALLDRL